jgi:hypothetical protein
MASKENYEDAIPRSVQRLAKAHRLTTPDWFVDSAEGTWMDELEAEVPVDDQDADRDGSGAGAAEPNAAPRDAV